MFIVCPLNVSCCPSCHIKLRWFKMSSIISNYFCTFGSSTGNNFTSLESLISLDNFLDIIYILSPQFRWRQYNTITIKSNQQILSAISANMVQWYEKCSFFASRIFHFNKKKVQLSYTLYGHYNIQSVKKFMLISKRPNDKTNGLKLLYRLQPFTY